MENAKVTVRLKPIRWADTGHTLVAYLGNKSIGTVYYGGGGYYTRSNEIGLLIGPFKDRDEAKMALHRPYLEHLLSLVEIE